MKSLLICFLLVSGVTLTFDNDQDKHPSDDLYLICGEQNCYDSVAYVNAKGDTIIPFGKYTLAYTDTFKNVAIVSPVGGGIIGIDRKGNKLYDVHIFDNGPDYVVEDRFRIHMNGKVGFADGDGNIVIYPKYDCAFPFSSGKAKVSYKCRCIKDGEYTALESDEWFYIDKNGSRIEE